MNHFHQTAFIAAGLLLTLQVHATSMPTLASTSAESAVQVAINPQPLPPRRPPPTSDLQPIDRA